MTKLNIGDVVPNFELKDENGTSFIFNAKGLKGWTVLYFYPMDDTPGCTKEACAFRDAFEDFTAAGAQVIGVSNDGQSKHEAFKAKHNLPFTLLTDENKKVQKLFGVKGSLLGFLPGRETFVIDSQGVLRHKFRSQIKAEQHVQEALSIIQSAR